MGAALMAECYISGYRYYGGIHHVLCQGPIDAVLELHADQRTAWLGPAQDGIYHANAPDLFGGDDGQGGIDGWFAVCLGKPNQPANTYLAQALGTLTWLGVELEIRLESWVLGSALVWVYGGMGGRQRLVEITLSDAAWHTVPDGDWDRLTQITAIAGFRGADIVIRRADTEEEIGRLPAAEWNVLLDWRYGADPIRVPAVIPAFRGVVSCIWSQTLLISNSAYWPSMEWKVLRCREWSGWYPGAQNINGGMNPAHILRDLITSPVWGLGYPAEAIDDDAFRASADTLYAERMGLNLIWDGGSVEEFAQAVLDHCNGRVYVHPRTGLWVLDLIRGGYNWADLPILDETSVVRVERYERGGWDETVGEVVVTYMDSYRGKQGRVTVHNAANIAIQGAVVSVTRDYPGIGNQSLARRKALDDLSVLSRPVAKATLVCNRIAWDWVPGQVLRWQWPEYGIIDAAYRLVEIDYGTLTDGHIRIEIVEDVFGLGRDRYEPADVLDIEQGVAAEQEAPDEPVLTALESPAAYATEAPYWLLAQRLSEAEMAALSQSAGYGIVFAAQPNAIHYDYRGLAQDQSVSPLEPEPWQSLGRGSFAPTALLTQTIGPSTTQIEVLSWDQSDQVVAGDMAVIAAGDGLGDEEWVRVDALDAAQGIVTLTRGMLDTVPSEHAAGSRIWFGADNHVADAAVHSDGSSTSYAIQPRTGQATITADVAVASAIDLDFGGRAARPYPPGNVRVNGDAYPTSLGTVDLVLTWAARDRTTAALVGQTEVGTESESGVTYSVRLYDADLVAVVGEWLGLSDTSLTITQADLAALLGMIAEETRTLDAQIEVWATRDGLESWQRQSRRFAVQVEW